jgi:glycosyltransferase involved in cell wall biosynthesis
MCEIERVPENQITVIYNGMEQLRKPTPQSVALTKAELGLADETVCLVPARLHEEKGHRFLFDALPEIFARVGPLTVLLAGAGPDRMRLEAEARTRRLEKFVRFLGRRDDMPELYSLATVVVLPSLAESFGFVLLEAMSMAKPVVASATGGIPEVVADGQSGLLVPQADSMSLANAVCNILQNPARARELGDAGRLHARQFTFERMICGYETVYQEN